MNQLRRLGQGREGDRTQIGMGADLDNLTGMVRQMNRLGDPNELANRLTRAVLPELERLEAELRQKLEAKGGGDVRTAAPETAPAGYADAVAEYFRKLSKAP